jgi:hypothetical protein
MVTVAEADAATARSVASGPPTPGATVAPKVRAIRSVSRAAIARRVAIEAAVAAMARRGWIQPPPLVRKAWRWTHVRRVSRVNLGSLASRVRRGIVPSRSRLQRARWSIRRSKRPMRTVNCASRGKVVRAAAVAAVVVARSVATRAMPVASMRPQRVRRLPASAASRRVPRSRQPRLLRRLLPDSCLRRRSKRLWHRCRSQCRNQWSLRSHLSWKLQRQPQLRLWFR